MDEMNFEPADFGFSTDSGERISLSDESETLQLGRALAETLTAGSFLGLVGNLGAGKTTLVRGLVHTFDASVEVTSPTYTLVHTYPCRIPIHHVDLYRLESEDDLESIGYWDYVMAGNGLLCVEWLDRVPAAWPGEGLVVVLEYDGSGRVATLWGDEGHTETVTQLVNQFGGSA